MAYRACGFEEMATSYREAAALIRDEIEKIKAGED
jgi:hypothetical protein